MPKGREKGISRFAVLVAAAAGALPLPSTASAAVITVSRGDDPAPDACVSGVDCSLREAVNTASANAEDDEIVLTQNVTLSIPGAGEGSNATGDLDISNENGEDLTVRSNDPATQRTINANGLDRAIDQLVGNLTLEHLRITGGVVGGFDSTGGAVNWFAFNAGETLRLDGVTLDGNAATSTTMQSEGGAIRAQGIGPVVQVVGGSVIDGNAAGGTADNTDGSGGGLFVGGQDSSLTITDSTISDNEAAAGPHGGTQLGRGGGIAFNSTNNAMATPAPLTITDSTISGNRAGGLGSDGNHNGGGIFISDTSSMAAPTLSITGGSVTGNFAGGGPGNAQGDGGGIGSFGTHGSITVDGVNLSNNRAGGNDGTADGTGRGFGAGIATELALTITDSTLSGNRSGIVASGDLEGAGGAVSSTGAGAVTISNSTLDGNLAGTGGGGGGSHGGALNVTNRGPLTITDSSLTNNVARTLGGAIERFRSPAVGADDSILRTTIAGNQSQLGGGGIDLSTAGTMVIERSNVSTNSASGTFGRGGGIALDGATFPVAGDGVLYLVTSTVSGNSIGDATFNDAGGGIAVGNSRAADLFVQESTIAGNTNTGGPGATGGNISARNSGTTVSFRSSIVADGVAPNGGNCAFLSSAVPATVGGSVEDLNECGLNPGIGDLVNTEPLLGMLQDNGGPTMTRALLQGSPAIDLPSAFCPGSTVDQRGFARPFPAADACDAGAYELQDLDGDGLRDTSDNCPTQAGPASNGGCPIPPTGQTGTSPALNPLCATLRKKLKAAKKRGDRPKVRKLRAKLRRLGC
jgi:fibronectin-binding autotransporter adhesin